jgi:membrane fusion protein (multidrug efflux system)
MKTSTALRVAAVLGLVLVVALLAGVKAGQIGKMIRTGKAFVPPPEAVTSAAVERGEWQPQREAIGTVVPVRGVTLGAELPGLVREVSFDSGASVRRGAVLVRLDTSTEEAQLAAAEAEASLARLSRDRARSLRQAGSSTPADLEAAEARAQQAEAAAEGLRATIAKKTIRAPFDGRVAIRQVEVGQVVSPGTPIASLHSVDPIYVDFWMPQQALSELRRGQRVHLHTDAFPGATWEGTIRTVNTEVDAATRNVRVRAELPNRDGRLLAGMFGKVEVLSGEARPVLFVPATAVLFAPYGDSVFVLEEQAGETVVSSGAFKLRNGAAVVVRNDLAPPAVIDPRPVDR